MISNMTKVIDFFFFSLGNNPFEIKSLVFSQISKIIFISLVKDREFIILTIMALSKVAYPGQLLGHQFWWAIL